MRHISKRGLALIKEFEGFSSKAYWLGDGRWTIGYGDTLGVTRNTGPWSVEFATKKLETRVRRDFEPYIHRLGIPLDQNQFDAVVSLIYNLGPGVLDRGRSMGDALRSSKVHDYAWKQRVARAIREYDMPGSKFHDGLKRRREAEVRLFLAPPPAAQKAKRLQAELDRIRATVRTLGHWTPKRKARAEAIKRALGSHPKV